MNTQKIALFALLIALNPAAQAMQKSDKTKIFLKLCKKWRPALFKTKFSIRKDIIEWQKQGLTAKEGLIKQFEEKKNNLRKLYIESNNSAYPSEKIKKHIDQEIKNALPQKIELKFDSTISPEKKEIVEKILKQYSSVPVDQFKDGTLLRPGVCIERTHNDKIFYTIKVRQSLPEDVFKGLLLHEMCHAKYSDSAWDDIYPNDESYLQKLMRYAIKYRMRKIDEYGADAILNLENDTLSGIKKFNSPSGTLAEIAPFLYSMAIVQTCTAFPTLLVLTNGFLTFLAAHFTPSSLSHPSDFKRWMALRTLEKYLKVEEEMLKEKK